VLTAHNDLPGARFLRLLAVSAAELLLHRGEGPFRQDARHPAQLTAFGLTAGIGEDHLFRTLPTAVAAYGDLVREHPERPPDGERAC
jgi:sulfate permease, SulP family